MALEIMQTLVEILCPTPTSASACNTFINAQSHQVVQPLGPLIYFLFFPVVFLILLIYIGTGVVLRGNVVTVRGLRLLLSIAVLVAIVIQGFYPIMLWLSDLWFLVLPFIFIFYFIVRHRGGPGGGGANPGVGVGALSFQRGVRKLLGAEKKDAESIRAQIQVLRDTPPGGHGIDELTKQIKLELNTFLRQTGVLGFPVLSEYDKLFKEFKDACNKHGRKDYQGLQDPKEAKKRGVRYNSAKNPSLN
jgi:hypothetical protein